jgi:diaminohydroxyphosphoribosylaminopyrimidine deaminase/5-amino-6-(5-phosphoribosylamino)uracil reductase
MTRGRPWLRLKVAASLDGKTALNNGESRSGSPARMRGATPTPGARAPAPC